MRRVVSVTASHCRRVSWTAANISASRAALASRARQIRARLRCRAAVCGSRAARRFVFGADGVDVGVAFGGAHEAEFFGDVRGCPGGFAFVGAAA